MLPLRTGNGQREGRNKRRALEHRTDRLYWFDLGVVIPSSAHSEHVHQYVS